MKNKTTHTPGPWSFCSDSGFSSKCLRGVQHSKKAAVHSGVGERPTIASHIENWNDARLIAAAPDLLVALRRIIRDTPEPPESDQVALSNWQAGRTAIAKT